ncbi:hypothetical protein OLX02_10965 [Novosphingobium sp. KCTC 2891]|nr:hypothetical protein [Novosphingobium sp. KCTC 2891]MCW1383345.1 hypothetical protein [Novosphingobium sp. KCTC 2891]
MTLADKARNLEAFDPEPAIAGGGNIHFPLSPDARQSWRSAAGSGQRMR